MAVFTQNFTVDQGADFVWSSPQYIVNGVVQDLSGSSCRMMLRVNPNDQGPTISLTNTPSSNGSIVQNGMLGTVTIDLTRVATAALTAGVLYQYDAFVDFPGGTSVRIVYGTILIAASITH